ncbi:UDP-N-acetyl-D-mannosamine dehydrogenase [Rothia sp. CCM 9416]|uniref:UDP-N-acetyl-D-mannosamine dehydrogenase n=1 Tax=Rothia sp. CCM 9416 TaxID=3402655 RepID=UPI003AEB712B
MNNKNIAFIGLGYIGLPTAVVLAQSGARVIGVDINPATVESISKGRVTIVEPGLDQALTSALASGNLTVTTQVPPADTYIIAVPTPFTEQKDGDLSYIMAAASSIAAQLRGGELIILESTSPPTTTQKLAQHIISLRPDLVADGQENPGGKPVIYFAYCPERILPGKALQELISNDRVIGGQTPTATQRAQQIYARFCTGQLLATDDVTAEMVKLTENSFRDVNIAFANELSMIAAQLGVNVWELIDLANHHPRVNILQPGPGVGGHCIAVDPWFIVAADPHNSRLIRTARQVNDSKPGWVIEQVQAESAHLDRPTIAVLGLAFKANIDDLRESPALEILTELTHQIPGARLLVVEPHIDRLPAHLSQLGQVELTDCDPAIAQADLVLLLVDHDRFKQVPATALAGKAVIDTKGLWR